MKLRFLPTVSAALFCVGFVLSGILLADGAFSHACAESSSPQNEGGVLLLHFEEDGGVDCDGFRLGSWDSAIAKVPADGQEHRLSIYAAFPPADSVFVAGVTFGIRYSPTVEIVSHGTCSGEGREVPQKDWPASGTGTAFAFQPFQTEPLFGVCWFIVRAKGPGFFEVTPHPTPDHAGAFGNYEVPVHLESIRGYGRIGFGFEGLVPEPGPAVPRGICCLDRCFEISQVDCAFYKGLYLGEGTDCQSGPCGENALKGACCLEGECVSLSRFECVKASGTFLGETVDCAPSCCVNTTGSR